MAEIRVQCPECQAKMKLTAAVEKVRCPKCDALFSSAQNRVKSTQQKRKSAATSSSDPFGFDDDDTSDDFGDDLFGDTPPAKKKSRPTKKSSGSSRRRKTNKSRGGELPTEQLRKFGFTMIALGIGAFVLPLVGLQIKGLHAMGPQAQALGGVCFLFLGSIVLLVSFKDNFGPAVSGLFDNGFAIVKWGAIGLVVLFFGVPLLMFAAGKALTAFKGDPHEQHMEEMAEKMQQEAEDFHQQTQAQHQRAMERINNAHNQGFQSNSNNNSNASMAANSNTNSSQGSSTETTPTSPFQDVTPGFSSTSNNSSSGTPSSQQSSGNNSSGTTSSSANSRRGDLTVTVHLKGFNRFETTRSFSGLRQAAGTFRMRPMGINDGSSKVEFMGVKDLQEFADRISVGTVTNVDAEKNEITVEK